jgi:hypothetical protein
MGDRYTAKSCIACWSYDPYAFLRVMLKYIIIHSFKSKDTIILLQVWEARDHGSAYTPQDTTTTLNLLQRC